MIYLYLSFFCRTGLEQFLPRVGLYSHINLIFRGTNSGLTFTIVCISGLYMWLLSCNWYDFISSGEVRFRYGLLSFLGIWFVLFYFSYLKFALLLWNIELIFML